MKKALLFPTLLFCLQVFSQSPSGYWYGNANVKLSNAYNNYMVELIIEQDGNNVKGVLNYFFKNTYRSFPIRGSYNPYTRAVYFSNIPVSYYGSFFNQDVDCDMNLNAVFRSAKAGLSLNGSFTSKPEYKYTCPEISFNLKLNKDASNKDSIIKAIKKLKESYQVWTPSESDTLISARIQQRNVVNYVIANQFKERENIVEEEVMVASDSIQVDFYDNGEIDGDSISVFFNRELIAFNRILSTRSIHIDLALDPRKEINELSMFADNLGSIPPNTALMVVTDGKRKYEVRLSSSFEKNATVRIRRKNRVLTP